MKERVLAVVGAVALVVVAILVRSALAGDDAGASSDDGAAPVVACSPSLAEVCDALADADLIAADPPTLALGDDVPAEVDGWIAWDPGPAVAGYLDDGGAADSAWPDVQGLGSAPLAVAGPASTVEAICGAADWSCIAEASAGRAINVGDPGTDEGLARIGPLARALTDGDIDQIGTSLDDLVTGPADGQQPAAEAAPELATKPGANDLVVGPLGLLEQVAESPAGQGKRIEVVIPDDPAVATVLLASRAGAVDAEAICRKMVDDEGVAAAAAEVGIELRCPAEPMDETTAGFLYQVRERVSG